VNSPRIPANGGLIGSTSTAVQHDRLNIARTFAREHQLILVLKGHRTLIASAGMARFGSIRQAIREWQTGGTGGHSHGDDCRFYRTNSGSEFWNAFLVAVHLSRPGRGCGS